MTDIKHLLELLAKHGGSIISSNDLDSESINQAKASSRMYVDDNSLGYIWEPSFAGLCPVTKAEVEMFEWCYPLPVEMPEKFKTPDFLFECKGAKCQIKNCKICKNEMY